MKKIIILGAGVYQVPLIEKAKQLGLYVIVVSIPGDYPGFDIADKNYYVSTTDKEEILEIARKEKISGIITTGTDVALSTIGYVCDKLGLPGLSFEAAQRATDKALMKKAFKETGVSTAEFRIVYSIADIENAISEIGYPVMLKIVDKSGSRGITKIENEEQILAAYEYAREYTNRDYFVLEKCIIADEIGVDAFVQNGEIKSIVPHRKLVYNTLHTGIPQGHMCPCDYSDNLNRKIIAETQAVVKALMLDDCAVNMDVFITEDEEVYVIEASGRCGATGIPEVIGNYWGMDYYEAILLNAIGREVEFDEKNKRCRPAASFLLFSQKSGYLKEISFDLMGQTYKNNNVNIERKVFVSLDYSIGDYIHEVNNGTDRIGMVIISADSIVELEQTLDEFNSSLKVVLE